MRVLTIKNGKAEYREMNPEEEAAYLAEMERLAAEMPKTEPTPEERLAALEEVFDTLLTGRKDQ